jgi:hypothetical protein
MPCCIVIAYLIANVRRRRRRASLPEQSAWLAYYYATSIESELPAASASDAGRVPTVRPSWWRLFGRTPRAA